MVDFFAYVFLMAVLLMLAGKIVRNNIILLIVQSLSLSVIAFYLGLSGETVDWHMVLVGVLTLLVKVIVLPWVLYRLIDKVSSSRVVLLSLGPVPSVLIGVFLVGLTCSYVVPVLLEEVQVVGKLLSVALSTILLGCFFMVSRRSTLSQLIGIIVMENGLFLCAVAVTGGMPLVIELGIFFDLLVGVLVMGVMTHQIRGTFDSLDTKFLNKLKH